MVSTIFLKREKKKLRAPRVVIIKIANTIQIFHKAITVFFTIKNIESHSKLNKINKNNFCAS